MIVFIAIAHVTATVTVSADSLVAHVFDPKLYVMSRLLFLDNVVGK